METRGFTVLTLSLYLLLAFGSPNDAPMLSPNIFTKAESGRCRAIEGNKTQSKEHQSKNHLSKKHSFGIFYSLSSGGVSTFESTKCIYKYTQ